MIVTLTGPNAFERSRVLNDLINDFVKQYGDIGLEKIDCEEAEYERIAEAVHSLPFLANKKLVILKSTSANKKFTEQIEQLIGSVPDTTDLIIVEDRLDKRLSYYKTLRKMTDFREYNELDNNGLARWAARYAQVQGGKLSLADAQYLVQRVGANQQMLAKEIDKLLTKDVNINRVIIDELTEPTPQSSIFDLLDAAFGNNSKRAIKVYEEQRAQKVEPQQIIAMLAWQLQSLAIVKTGGQKSVDEIAREAKMSPYVVRKSQALASKMDMLTLRKLIKSALELDIRLKTESIDADDALQYYLINIATF